MGPGKTFLSAAFVIKGRTATSQIVKVPQVVTELVEPFMG